ncbi:RDD family protein [Ketobacter sp. MCCC 1A13808]|uniref:RDD family protein n=1 Tax=Ketobacter sp. MCCC 1A13808 TaxID=2602738 RepID=UPI000F284C9C|nr:RDD family protein [Ketobacter sp. MCCC 1A13808]MVF13994.1 RDD family protein [Ketobacter sp. MCCC 1A13808]RLP53406.1 MAG: RDD family protein [Ketobacter sp.]
MTTKYETPQSELVDELSGSGELASRWARLGASLIDTVIMLILASPIMVLTGTFSAENLESGGNYIASLMLGLVFIGIFFLINYRFLTRDGQTIGKKALSIRIVDLDGQIPDFKSNLIPRYAVYMLPGQIPLIGQLFSFINVCFIFRADKRCIHDLAGKTRVVKC